MTKLNTLQEFENFYETMMPAKEKSKESFAWFSGIPHPLFNTVMHLTIKHNLGDKVEALISEAPKGIPLSFWVHSQNESSGLVEVLKEKGFQSIATCPLMTWNVKPMNLPKCTIEIADLEIFHHILATTFQFDEAVKEGFAKLLENAEAENYLIYHEGQPVGTGTLIPNGKTGGIFNIATLPKYQKKGFGQSMMQFLMVRASTLGLEKLILLSSPLAEKLYSDLAFTKCFDIEIYARLSMHLGSI